MKRFSLVFLAVALLANECEAGILGRVFQRCRYRHATAGNAAPSYPARMLCGPRGCPFPTTGPPINVHYISPVTVPVAPVVPPVPQKPATPPATTPSVPPPAPH